MQQSGYHFEIDRRTLHEVYQISEEFNFNKTMSDALDFYLRYLKQRQQGMSVIAVPSTINAKGHIVPDKNYLRDFSVL
jgi:hypothetical protein